MLKEYIQKKKISIYKLSKETGIPYSTLMDIVNGNIHISRCSAGNVRALAQYLQLSMDEVFDLCAEPEANTVSFQLSGDTITGTIRQSGKKFYLDSSCHGKEFHQYLCKVNACNRKYINFIAETKLMNIFFEENR